MSRIVSILMVLMFAVMVGANVSPLTEDDPAWDCYSHGNMVCGATEREAVAWEAWDASYESERLDPTVAHRVEYVGAALTEPLPSIEWITVSWEDGYWYVFRAEHI